ncbi:MAG: hypothetical protein GC164_06280 [Phycisphaera sp.]|nr:hypothetical protein [Phycisphaera sp.]
MDSPVAAAKTALVPSGSRSSTSVVPVAIPPRISDFDMANKNYPDWTMVRKAQVDVADSSDRFTWVDTDDLNGKTNGLHYTAEGYKELGKRFAEKAIALVKR